MLKKVVRRRLAVIWELYYSTNCDVHESVHRDIIVKITNKMQLYRLIYYSKSALHSNKAPN